MNVPYNQINTTDAAKIIGVSYATLAGWCHDGRINVIDVSDGTGKSRYMLTEKEVYHIKKLREAQGRSFITHYDKDWDVPEPVECLEEREVIQVPLELPETEKQVPVKYPNENDLPTRKPLNLDNITTTISYMQDIRDRLAAIEKERKILEATMDDLEAEKNQLTNEYADLKREVVDQL